MYGIGIYLSAFADYLTRRKYDKQKRCDVCGQKFETFERTEIHRRESHSNARV